jgi:hypothetical protein
VSRRKWPWHRCVVLGLLILVVGIVGGWLLASCTTPDTTSSSSMSAMPSTETITVTIPDKDEQLSPDHPDQTGVKDRVEISDAVLEKLALLLRPPLASGASTWGPLIVGVLAAIGAPVGVFFTLQQKGKSDNQSEWWRRTAWAFERTFSADNAEAELGWNVLATLTRSRLVTSGDSEIIQVIAEHVALAVST